MMMESAPPAAFEVIQAELILEFLIIPLDSPAELGQADEGGDRHRLGQGRQPVLRGLGVPAGPLDQEPLLWARGRPLLIAMGGPHPEPREAGPQGPRGAFPPG